MSKYHSKKIETPYGWFDSKREYSRYKALRRLLNEGAIKDLNRQKKFVLIPAQREPDTFGARGGKKKGKIIERECAYYADFTYYDVKSGKYIVEDCKGFRTKDYKIKKKLMLYVHGVRITET